VAALRALSRLVALVLGLPLLAGGGVVVGLAHAPDLGVVKVGRSLLVDALTAVDGALGLGLQPDGVLEKLAASPLAYALPAVGLLLLAFALKPRRGGAAEESAESDEGALSVAKLDRSTRKRAEKQVKDLVKQGKIREAADLCFTADQLDKAVELYIQCDQVQRAAEIRHDQNRFDEAADLFARAGRHESAAAIYAEREEWEKAADCFVAAGRKSMAAEMYEKAGQHAKAAQAFQDSGFQRHAAQEWVRCQQWGKAAASLEEVIADEGARVGSGDSKKDKEVRTLVMQCAKLHEQAGDVAGAARVLERGNCLAAAAALAVQLGDHGRAAELYQKAGEMQKSAESLRAMGEDKAAAQLLGEYQRDQGDDEGAAVHFEQAGDFLSAGDIYRKLQQHAKAGECFERNHDSLQAAEMFRLAGDAARAAQAYESSQKFDDAAACWEEAGDPARQAQALVQAERYLEAGRLLVRQKLYDEAIKVLQKVAPDSPDLPKASAILGRIFKDKGMFPLSVKKLRQAIGSAELGAENIDAYYMLAVVYDSNRQFRDAVDIFEKILAQDYHYGDVEDRLDAAREKLKLAEMKDGAQGGGTQSSSGSLTPSGNSRYQIVAELGRGGMGIVYKAQDTVLDRVVAYKVLPDALKENPQALKNFLREAKSAAQLNHPGIVTVFDAGEQDGRYYIAMEYVDGTTLKEILKRRGVIAPGGVTHVLAQMCEALAYAHEQKIVHRDIKAANTMWTRDKKAKIMDFGLAKVLEEVRNHTTLVSGTPYYMSPEQTLGKNVDHRTDIYSLGVTIFELCTGRLPFMEGNIPYHHVHTPPPDILEVNPELPPVLAEVVKRCMQKNPDERYASTKEILAQLKAARARTG
jgi:tetratricopeptide (TPR) repeat protein